MQENISEKFLAELLPEERIYWSGQPQQGFFLRNSDALMIPISLLWGGSMFLWEFLALTKKAPFFFMLCGIPFVLIGLYCIVGRFFADVIRRRKTYYALTNKRVLIISGINKQNTKIIELIKTSEINISTKRNGKGTITFGSLPPMAWMLEGNFFPTSGKFNKVPSFELIDDAKKVYQQIKILYKENS